MLEIKLTVEILGIPDAINNLAAAIRGQAVTAPAVASTPTAPAVAPTQSVNPTSAVETAAPVAVAPAMNATAVPTSPAASNPTVAITTPPFTAPTSAQIPAQPPVPEKKITAEDISRAGASLVDQGKMADVINLLKRYGVQAITQLKEDIYPAFANDLRALGATL